MKRRRDGNAGLVHMRNELALESGTSLGCVDVLELRSQTGSSNFKLVKPFGTELIALKGKKEKKKGKDPLEILQVENLFYNDFCKT